MSLYIFFLNWTTPTYSQCSNTAGQYFCNIDWGAALLLLSVVRAPLLTLAGVIHMVFWQGKCWQLPLAFNGRIIKAALPGLSSARIPWPQRSHKNTLAKVGNHAAVCAQAWMCASAQTRSISTFLHTWELDITWPCWGSCMWIFQVNILKADAHDGSPVLISVGTVNLIFFFGY